MPQINEISWNMSMLAFFLLIFLFSLMNAPRFYSLTTSCGLPMFKFSLLI